MTDELRKQIHTAIEEALPESDTLTLAPSQIRHAATAAFSAVRPRLEELEEALARIAQPVFIAEPIGTPDSAWRVALNGRIEIAKAALAAKEPS